MSAQRVSVRAMKVAIIGGGAAGLMAAAALTEMNPSADIWLIEKNDGLGKKVIISGGGRCNVTTGIRDIRTVLTKYPRGTKFLSKAMYAFSPEAVYDWFEAHGVPMKVEEDLRAFPQSDDGEDVVRAFEYLFSDSNVHVMLKAQVTHVQKDPAGYKISFRGDDVPIIVDNVILTTGGQAYRHTGSTGDGYAFAMELGHTITPLAPSLNAFTTKEQWPKTISGLSFEQATLSAYREKKTTFTGPFLFTHRGVSGPAVFALSSLVAFEPYGPNEPLAVTIDLFPKETAAELSARLMTAITNHPKKSMANVLDILLPKSLVHVVCQETGVLPDRRANEISKKEIAEIITWLKNIPLTVIGRDAGDEFVTAGGVSLDEVDPSTMQSKISPGLYFAGEILNIDGFTGGFNLQASWATGHLAGESIGR